MHGWYSKEQFEVAHKMKQKLKKRHYTYIYYTDMSDNIVQITEVTAAKNYTSKFKDVEYLGELKAFYKGSETPIDIKSSIAP